MNNDKTIEKLAENIYTAMRFLRMDETPDWVAGGNSTVQTEARSTVTTILAEFQTDPMAYVKPKLLVWVQAACGQGFIANTSIGQYAYFDDGEPRWAYSKRGYYTYHYTDTGVEAKDAAYAHLCEKTKELF